MLYFQMLLILVSWFGPWGTRPFGFAHRVYAEKGLAPRPHMAWLTGIPLLGCTALPSETSLGDGF